MCFLIVVFYVCFSFFFALIPPGTKKLSLFHYFQKMCDVVVVVTWVVVIPYVVIGRFLWFSLRCQLHTPYM